MTTIEPTPRPDTDAIYRDPSRTIDERVSDLLGRMTTTEKAAQLGSAYIFQLVDGTELAERALTVTEHGLGQVTRLCGASSLRAVEAARAANTIQRHLVEHTRLGIPAIIHEEICAGLASGISDSAAATVGVAIQHALASTVPASQARTRLTAAPRRRRPRPRPAPPDHG